MALCFRGDKSNVRQGRNPKGHSKVPSAKDTISTIIHRVASDISSLPTACRSSLKIRSAEILDLFKVHLAQQKANFGWSHEESQSALTSRMSIALLRNISRDMKALKRLEGRTNVKARSINGKWWAQQMGTSIETVPLDLWGEARTLSSRHLESRASLDVDA